MHIFKCQFLKSSCSMGSIVSCLSVAFSSCTWLPLVMTISDGHCSWNNIFGVCMKPWVNFPSSRGSVFASVRCLRQYHLETTTSLGLKFEVSKPTQMMHNRCSWKSHEGWSMDSASQEQCFLSLFPFSSLCFTQHHGNLIHSLLDLRMGLLNSVCLYPPGEAFWILVNLFPLAFACCSLHSFRGYTFHNIRILPSHLGVGQHTTCVDAPDGSFLNLTWKDGHCAWNSALITPRKLTNFS